MRPRYHYAPARNWLSDPNGLVHHAGEWHLFYQYNPQGEDWGHMSWGHAVSRDLASWEELPVAIEDDTQHMIFSGSAVIDHDDTAGFGKEAMVALYTGAMSGEPARQVQCLASSVDKGRNWSLYSGNPVIDLGLSDFRDPNVFWHAQSRRWIMVVVLSNENSALLYASDNLRDWQKLSEISGTGAPGEIWECPLLITLPVEDGGSRWLFKVDVLRDAPGSGAIYCTGNFDGTTFSPDEGTWKVADWGADFYAAIAWHEPRDAKGRPLWIGWMGNHAYQGRLPLKGWRGAMSVPRRIWLRRSAEGFVLCQQVDPAVSKAVPDCGHRRFEGLDWQLVLGDGAGRSVEVTRRPGSLVMVRRDLINPFLDVRREVALEASAPVDIWVDSGSVELIADAGALALTMQHGMTLRHVEQRLERAVFA
jgi:sucrose-6-phosphate hydrolase SacC (GH32 family)